MHDIYTFLVAIIAILSILGIILFTLAKIIYFNSLRHHCTDPVEFYSRAFGGCGICGKPFENYDPIKKTTYKKYCPFCESKEETKLLKVNESK